MSDVQVLAPMNRGTVGTGRLNEALQEALNPNGFEVVRGGRKVRVDDKVMQIRNNYDKVVYNGDIGLVTDINTEDQAVHVDIDGNDIVYDYAELDELVLAYAVSIHKSQGSEYPVVVPVMTQHYVMLQRNLVYTGITRGTCPPAGRVCRKRDPCPCSQDRFRKRAARFPAYVGS